MAINVDGIVGSIVDLRNPSQPPQGQHWLNEPQRYPVRADEIGQVFGIALDDQTSPNVYLTATSAYGLHRKADNADWMPGMWGAGGGPGTVWKIDATKGYKPAIFAQIGLNGRANTGAALGNIAYDKWNRQLYVSDLETGLIHRLKLDDGTDIGQFDHGLNGRATFLDVPTGEKKSLPEVTFDPATASRILDCPNGPFAKTPSCWNFADFRRRVWGLGVRKDDESGAVRLYYAIWGSEGFGNPDFSTASEFEKRNSIWSIAIKADGEFDESQVRMEFVLPDFFTMPLDISRFGFSRPVADIAFCKCEDQKIMLVSERGGVRNPGLDAEEPFAYPHQSRVLRYELDEERKWSPQGRYDVGFYDRKNHGQPFLRANSSGGIDFGYGYQLDWSIDLQKPDQFVWMNGDNLCSPHGPCLVPDLGKRIDGSDVHGSQGIPELAFADILPRSSVRSYPPIGLPDPPTGPRQSYMIDTDRNIDGSGAAAMESLAQRDATKVGDIEIYQLCDKEAAVAEPPLVEEEPEIEEPPTVVDIPPEENIPDLEKVKDGPAECIEGEICTFTITITNRGSGIWSGPLWEFDTLPAGALLMDYRTQPDWLCNQIGGTQDVICNYAWADLSPGDSIALEIDVFIPAGMAGQTVENCVEDIWLLSSDPNDPAVVLAIEQALAGSGYFVGPIDGILDVVTMNAISQFQLDNGLPQTGLPNQAMMDLLFGGSAAMPGDADPTNDMDCHTVDIISAAPPPATPPPPDIEVRKAQITGQCRAGEVCTFRLFFMNRGPGDWTGTLELIDTLPQGATLVNAPVGCSQVGRLVTCRYPRQTSLPPNKPGWVNITVRMPNNLQPGAQNCINTSQQTSVNDPNPANNQQCIPVRIAMPMPDIKILKSQTTSSCVRGDSCTFDIWFVNRGPGKWTGVPELSDALPHGVTFDRATASWKCRQSNFNLTCSHDRITLQPGEGLKVSMTVNLPVDIADDARNCVRSEGDARQDSVQANNEQCITIRSSSEPADSTPPKPPPHEAPKEPEIPPSTDPSNTRTEKSQLGPCKPGRSCIFEIRFINDGPGVWSGKAKVADLLPESGIKLGTWTPSSWNCVQKGKIVSCEHSGAIVAAGQHLSLTTTLQLPEPFHQGRQNCAVVERPEIAKLDPALIGDRHCVTIDIQSPGFAPHPPAVIQPRRTCPEGTVRRRGECITITRSCPKGYRLRGDKCYGTTRTCPKGYVLKGRRCYSTQRKCPKGYVLRGRKCYPRRRTVYCPRGYARIGNICIRIPPVRVQPRRRRPSGRGHGHPE